VRMFPYGTLTNDEELSRTIEKIDALLDIDSKSYGTGDGLSPYGEELLDDLSELVIQYEQKNPIELEETAPV
jgi:hypothetical protein